MFRFWPVCIFIVSLFSFIPGYILAENIRNYSGCEVCSGGIHLDHQESRAILSESAKRVIQMMRSKRKGVKIDLDDVLPRGSQDASVSGYEIYCYGYDPFYIKSLIDGSRIQVVTDPVGARAQERPSAWQPEIYLYSGKSYDIVLSDSVETGWEKLRGSHIYFWVSSINASGMAANRWLDALGKRIADMLHLMYS